jgi:hypothetical protein
MKVQIMEEVWEYPNDSSEVEGLFTRIDRLLHETDRHLSYLIIDKHEIYDDYQDYISTNIQYISEIEVIVKTIHEVTNDLLLSLEQYLNNALPRTEQLFREFYQGSSQDAWNRFLQLIEGLQWIFHLIHLIGQNRSDLEEWNQSTDAAEQIKALLPELEAAIGANDTILLGDALAYELLPLMRSLYDSIRRIVDRKVVRTNVN